MAKVDRLVRAKKRLTRLLTERENEQLEFEHRVRPNRWLRTRIYRVDLLLEREGLL